MRRERLRLKRVARDAEPLPGHRPLARTLFRCLCSEIAPKLTPAGVSRRGRMDLAVEIIHATVQLEQALGDGTRTVGTGFLISAPGEDGPPRTVLITANHVFQKMPGVNARIGYRIANKDGSWSLQKVKSD